MLHWAVRLCWVRGLLAALCFICFTVVQGPSKSWALQKRGFYIVFMFIYYLDAAFMFIYCLCLVQVDEQQTWRGV